MMNKILVLNGPNLNLLGNREPEIYGTKTLEAINEDLKVFANQLPVELILFQSNAEHELLNRIQSARFEGIGFIVINPGAYTHTSIAIRDALLAVAIPFIEVHLSNPLAREAFRKHSYVSDIAAGVISGFGFQGYRYAIEYAFMQMTKEKKD
ncbi:MAG: type II 3-dehydroquinate dehydratase [Neisseriaceae bacterium]